MVDLPGGATEDRVCGTIDIEKATKPDHSQCWSSLLQMRGVGLGQCSAKEEGASVHIAAHVECLWGGALVAALPEPGIESVHLKRRRWNDI